MTPARSREYSPLRHLALSIWLNHDPKERYMANFTAYFDASGHPDAKGSAMFVSGFIAPISEWVKFEREWLSLLAEYGIKNPFHMAEFIACSEQFVGWKHNEKRQLEFYGRALKVIQRRTNRAISQGVIVDDFWKLVNEYVIPDDHAAASSLKTPLSFCAVGACIQIAKWANRRRRRGLKMTGTIEIVFDRGDKHRGQMATALRDVFNTDPIFKDKKDVVPIQAADILAWEHARVCGIVIDGNVQKLRMSSWPDIQRLFPGSDEWAYLDAKKMAALFDEQGLQKRERVPTPEAGRVP